MSDTKANDSGCSDVAKLVAAVLLTAGFANFFAAAITKTLLVVFLVCFSMFSFYTTVFTVFVFFTLFVVCIVVVAALLTWGTCPGYSCVTPNRRCSRCRRRCCRRCCCGSWMMMEILIEILESWLDLSNDE